MCKRNYCGIAPIRNLLQVKKISDCPIREIGMAEFKPSFLASRVERFLMRGEAPERRP